MVSDGKVPSHPTVIFSRVDLQDILDTRRGHSIHTELLSAVGDTSLTTLVHVQVLHSRVPDEVAAGRTDGGHKTGGSSRRTALDQWFLESPCVLTPIRVRPGLSRV